MSIYDDALKNFLKRKNEFEHDQKLFASYNKDRNEYLAGPDKEVLPLGSRYKVDFLKAQKGFIRFEGRKIAEKRVISMDSTDRELERKDLGHDNRSEWEPGIDGTLNDPWKPCFEIPTHEVSGEKRMIVFTGKNTSFKIAWDRLFATIFPQAAANAGKKPMVELSTGTFKGKFGLTTCPAFVLVEWVASDEDGEADGDLDEDEFDDDPPF
jgi:hypothetical protein